MSAYPVGPGGVSPQRIQRQRVKGWRMPEGAVYVGRPSRWGNPFVADEFFVHGSLTPDGHATWALAYLTPEAAKKVAVDLFLRLAQSCWDPSVARNLTDPEYVALAADMKRWRDRIGGHPTEMARFELRGKDLACWCPLDAPCHADVLLELANA